jgi:hypothetical protein
VMCCSVLSLLVVGAPSVAAGADPSRGRRRRATGAKSEAKDMENIEKPMNNI